jgi:hypothetical protein
VEIEVATVEIKPVADEKKGLKQCLLLMGWEVLLRRRELHCNVAMFGW